MNNRLKEIDIANKKARIERARCSCFGKSSRLYDSTFDNDKYPDSHLGILSRRYVKEWGENKVNGTGVFMYGDTGIGKSFYGACITNELLLNDSDLHKDLRVFYTFLPSLEFLNKNEQIAILNAVKEANFAFLDEFDASAIPKSAVNFYFTLFNTIYEQKIPFVLTTNASPESIYNDKKSNTIFAKIYDRIAHQCAKYGFQTHENHIRMEIAKCERNK